MLVAGDRGVPNSVGGDEAAFGDVAYGSKVGAPMDGALLPGGGTVAFGTSGASPPPIALPCGTVRGVLGIRTCGCARAGSVGNDRANIPIANILHEILGTKHSSRDRHQVDIKLFFEEAG
jgi:hypothetical protein